MFLLRPRNDLQSPALALSKNEFLLICFLQTFLNDMNVARGSLQDRYRARTTNWPPRDEQRSDANRPKPVLSPTAL